jgi:ABC-2 type transport system ATP-binding protein
MLQRIGIAQALVNDPELVILDEPMSGLDPVGRREVRNLMLALNRQGKTVFFSSHILSDIEALCTRIAFLEKGALKYCGPVSEIVSPGRQDYEILFRLKNGGLAGAAPELAGAQPVGNRFRLIVSGHEEARRAAEICWRDGGEVLSFSPVHRSLEEILFSGGGAA